MAVITTSLNPETQNRQRRRTIYLRRGYFSVCGIKDNERQNMKKITTLSAASLIKVQFFQPKNGCYEFYFGSFAAIYEMFDASEVGCRLEALWAANIDEEHPKATRLCVVSKHKLYRKSQKKSKFAT